MNVIAGARFALVIRRRNSTLCYASETEVDSAATNDQNHSRFGKLRLAVLDGTAIVGLSAKL